jgi:protein-tyrosine phosphatase
LADLNASESIAKVFHAFGDRAAYPVYFHCTYGRDRTGVVGALLLLALGVSRQDVMTDYLLSKDSVGAYPDSLDAVLDEIERRGGGTQVLHELGISEQELAVLRSHVVSEQP